MICGESNTGNEKGAGAKSQLSQQPGCKEEAALSGLQMAAIPTAQSIQSSPELPCRSEGAKGHSPTFHHPDKRQPHTGPWRRYLGPTASFIARVWCQLVHEAGSEEDVEEVARGGSGFSVSQTQAPLEAVGGASFSQAAPQI